MLIGHGLMLFPILLTYKIITVMGNFNNLPVREKVTLCYKNSCTTVYGETAKIVNAIVLTVVVVSAISLIAKTLE